MERGATALKRAWRQPLVRREAVDERKPKLGKAGIDFGSRWGVLVMSVLTLTAVLVKEVKCRRSNGVVSITLA